jgi:hypothetical protein
LGHPTASFATLAARLGEVARTAILAASDAFNPSLTITGIIQPTIFGFPLGEPLNEVELILNKHQFSFATEFNLKDLIKAPLSFIPFAGGLVDLLTLGIDSRLTFGFRLPFLNAPQLLDKFSKGLAPELNTLVQFLNPLTPQWEVLIGGTVTFLGFPIAKMNGFMFPPQDADGVGCQPPAGLFKEHVKNIDTSGDGDLSQAELDAAATTLADPATIPITKKSRYDATCQFGGILLSGNLMLPKIVLDTPQAISAIDWTPPDTTGKDPAEIFSIYQQYIGDIITGLTANAELGRVQLYVPSPAKLFDLGLYLPDGSPNPDPAYLRPYAADKKDKDDATDEKLVTCGPTGLHTAPAELGGCFQDLGNGRFDGPEPFVDRNGNGLFDSGDAFVDENGNGVFDSKTDTLIDLNGDGVPTGDLFIDVDANRKYFAGETFTDSDGDGRYDEAEPFADLNHDGNRDASEDFRDLNGNGVFDAIGESFVDQGNGLFDGAVPGVRRRVELANLDQMVPDPLSGALVKLSERVVQILQSAYFEGLLDLRLFGVEFGKMRAEASLAGIEFDGTYLGAEATFGAGWRNLNFNQTLLDLAESPFVKPVLVGLGIDVDGGALSFLTSATTPQFHIPFPTAKFHVRLGTDGLSKALHDSFGLPAGLFDAARANVSFDAFSPGYAPKPDPGDPEAARKRIEHFGGFRLEADLNVGHPAIGYIVEDAHFLFEAEFPNLADPATLLVQNFRAEASIETLPLLGVTSTSSILNLEDFSASIVKDPDRLAVALQGDLVAPFVPLLSIDGDLTVAAATGSGNSFRPAGIFGDIALEAGNQQDSSSDFFNAGAAFRLQLNTCTLKISGTDRCATTAELTDSSVAKRPAGGRIHADGHLEVFEYDLGSGTFDLAASGNRLDMSAALELNLGPFGSTDAAGSLSIRSTGLKGDLAVTAADFNPLPGLIEIDGRFTAHVDTAASELALRLRGSDGTGSASATLFGALEARAQLDFDLDPRRLTASTSADLVVPLPNPLNDLNLASADLELAIFTQDGGTRIEGSIQGQSLGQSIEASLDRFGCFRHSIDGVRIIDVGFPEIALDPVICDQHIFIDDQSVSEGNSGGLRARTVRVRLTEPPEDFLTIELDARAGSATSPADFKDPAQLSVFFPKSATTSTVANLPVGESVIEVFGDALVEGDESFSIEIGSVDYGDSAFTIADDRATVTLLDDDTLGPPVTVTLTAAGGLAADPPDSDRPNTLIAHMSEGNSGTKSAQIGLRATALRSGDSLEVRYRPVGSPSGLGTLELASRGSDFEMFGGWTSVTLFSNSTRTVSIPIGGDTIYELDETFEIEFQIASAASRAESTDLASDRVRVTIRNDDPERPADALAFYNFDQWTNPNAPCTSAIVFTTDPTPPTLAAVIGGECTAVTLLGTGPSVTASPLRHADDSVLNRAIMFDGKDDLAVGTTVKPLPQSDVTIEFWVNPTVLDRIARDIVGLGPTNGLSIYLGTDDKFHTRLVRQSGSRIDHAFGRPIVGRWQHVAVTFNGAQLRAYVDGNLAGTVNASGAIHYTGTNADRQIVLGSTGIAPHSPFQGSLDELRVWSKALDAEEIKRLSRSLMTGQEDELIVNWRFDESSGTTAGDATGFGQTALLGNGVAARQPVPITSETSVDYDQTTPSGVQLGTGVAKDGPALPNVDASFAARSEAWTRTQPVFVSANLLVNGGGEVPITGGVITGWGQNPVNAGAAWGNRPANGPTPFEGTDYFHPLAGSHASGTLIQEVSVADRAAAIDAGRQEFLFTAFHRSKTANTPDGARLLVDYLDDERSVITTVDSGVRTDTADWHRVVDRRVAPVGTRFIRVSLVGTDRNPPGPNGARTIDSYFDDVSLQAIDVEKYYEFTITLSPPTVSSGDPNSPSRVAFTGIDFWSQADEQGPSMWEIRSSIDGYRRAITSDHTLSDLTTNYVHFRERAFDDPSGLLACLKPESTPITFRLYGLGSSDGAAWSIDNLALLGRFQTAVECNAQPVALDRTLNINEDSPVSIDFSTLISDAESDDSKLTLTMSAKHGTITGSGLTRLYTPPLNFYGDDHILYQVADGLAETTGRISIRIAPVNDAPSAGPAIERTTPEDTPVSIDVLAGASDLDGDALQLVANSATQPMLTLPDRTKVSFGSTSTNGRFVVFTPPQDAFSILPDGTPLAAQFQYTVSDSHGGSTVGTIRVAVTPVNDPPSFATISNQAIMEDAGAITVTITGVSSGSFENQSVTVSATSNNTALIPHPNVSGNGGTRSLSFAPAANRSGGATITVTANDGQPSQNLFTRTFQVTVTSVNDPPTFDLDFPGSVPTNTASLILPKNAPQVCIDITNVSAGPANEAEQIVRFSSSSNKTTVIATPDIFKLNGKRIWAFQPAPNKTGKVVLTVTANDGQSQNATLVRSLTVDVITPPANAPKLAAFDLCGIVANGLVSGATVWFDANMNGTIDYLDLDGDGFQAAAEPLEPSTSTGADGHFNFEVLPVFDRNGNGRLDSAEGHLAAVGGFVSATHLPVDTVWTAPAGSRTITPLTQLVTELTDRLGLSQPEAMLQIAAALGLQPLDLTRVDHVGGTIDGDVESARVAGAIARIRGMTVPGTAALTGAGRPAVDVSRVLTNVLAQRIVLGTPLDLMDLATVTSVIEASSARLSVQLAAEHLAGIAQVIAAGNARLAALDGMAGLEMLETIAQIEVVSQGELANALRNLGTGTLPIDELIAQFTGDALAARIAAASIGTIAPPIVSIDDVTQLEAAAGTTSLEFHARLSSASTVPVLVNYLAQNGSPTSANGQVEPSAGTIEFAPGETDRTITLTLRGDTAALAPRNIIVELSDPRGAVLGWARGTGTLLEDNAAASNVTAVTRRRGRTLVLTGDPAANILAIEQIGSGAYRVLPGAGTTLNGQSGPLDFHRIDNMLIALGSGNDSIRLGNPAAPLSLNKALSIDTGAGRDVVLLDHVTIDRRTRIASVDSDEVQLVDSVLGNLVFSGRRDRGANRRT